MNIKKNDVTYVLKICAVLLIITMCVAALLAFVNGVTKETIATNEKTRISEALATLFPDAAAPEATEIKGEFGDTVNGLYVVEDGDTEIGYYADVSGKGFKGVGSVGMMVGISLDGKVVGIEIIKCDETIGIGTKIKDAGFLSGFIGRSGSVSYEKGALPGTEGIIDGISGATYSSKAVIDGVDAALKAYNAQMNGEGGE